MNKVIRYDLIIDDDKGDFVYAVNHKIKLGWQPFGSPSIVKNVSNVDHSLYGVHYVQAMVKYDNEMENARS